MTSKIEERLTSIESKLKYSAPLLNSFANYCRILNSDLFLLNSSLRDDCSTINRIIVDSWLCELERQQDVNSKLITIIGKLKTASKMNIKSKILEPYYQRISEIDASIQDGFFEKNSTRPVEGIISINVPPQIEKDITDLEIANSSFPIDWSEWRQRISSHFELVNKLVKLFPSSHSFGSKPSSISILLESVLEKIKEQEKYEKLLKVLTENNIQGNHNSIFGIDILIIEDRLKPIPIYGDSEQ